jgi:hypothetical protein
MHDSIVDQLVTSATEFESWYMLYIFTVWHEPMKQY